LYNCDKRAHLQERSLTPKAILILGRAETTREKRCTTNDHHPRLHIHLSLPRNSLQKAVI
jgi:hypothetical protein